MATFTSTTDGNINDGATYGNTSPGSAGTDFPDDTDICVVGGSTTITLNVDYEVRALKITGTMAGGGNTITVNGATSNKPFDNDGTITGDLNVTITNTGVQQDGLLLDAMGTSGNINNLTLNLANGTTANKTVGIASSTTLDNTLTITSGVFDTVFDGGSSVGLTVGGHVFGNGTLIANDSSVTIAGQCTVANVELTAGSITSNDDYRPSTKTTIDGNGTITAAGASQMGGLFDIGATNTPTLNAGRLHSSLDIPTGNQGQSTFNLDLNEDQTTGPARHVFFYNLELDSEGTENNTYTMQDDITCTNDLTITDGEINTGSDHSLTVTGDIEIADGGPKLSYNGSTVSCARLGVGLGGVGKIDGTEAGKIIVNGTGNARILDLAGAILTGDTVTFEYQGQATTATQALSGLSSGTFNLIINSDGATEKCIPNASVTALNDLTVTDGEFELPSSTNIEAAGDLIIAAAGVADLNPASSDGNVTFRSVVISSGGTLEAPSHGSFTLTGTLSAWSFQNNSTNFNHNNGTITQQASGHIKSVSSNPFYNFTMNSSSSDDHNAIFRASSGTDVVLAENNVTVTRGKVYGNTTSDNLSVGSLTVTSTSGTFIPSSNTNSITAGAFDIGANTFSLGTATLSFTGASSAFASADGAVFSAGPGATISGYTTGDKSDFDAQSNFAVVGTVEKLNNNGPGSVLVTGKVLNCDGNFITLHPQQDAAQQLDKSSEADRETTLGRDLDRATELVG